MVMPDKRNKYAVKYDEEARLWRILDLWDDDLKKYGPEDEIPDNHKAVTKISEAAFVIMLQEAEKLGILEHFFGVSGVANQEKVETLEKELKLLREENLSLKKTVETAPKYSESFELKKLIAGDLLKLIAADGLEKLDK